MRGGTGLAGMGRGLWAGQGLTGRGGAHREGRGSPGEEGLPGRGGAGREGRSCPELPVQFVREAV